MQQSTTHTYYNVHTTQIYAQYYRITEIYQEILSNMRTLTNIYHKSMQHGHNIRLMLVKLP
jgi:hypothetical protein